MKTIHAPRHSRGFSIIELMIGVALGLVILAALTSFFVSTSASRHEMERTSRNIENGRFAIDALRTEIHLSGFYAELQTTGATWNAANPCTTTLAGMSFTLGPPMNLPLPVFGYATDAAMPACVTDRVPGTDVLVLRRFHTEPIAPGSAVGTEYYFQPSRCRTDSTLTPWVFDQGSNAGAFGSLRKVDCTTRSDLYRMRVEVFYLRTWSLTNGDGIPTLVKLELENGAMTILPMVEGIQNMRLEYGIDNNGDGAPDEYRRCDVPTPCDTTQWTNVVAIRAHVLAVNLEQTIGYTDTKEYDMGSGATRMVGPFNDRLKRHIYSAVVSLINRTGPRE